MKARPILFSAPMVRALLEGRKTQTRRIIKPQPLFYTGRNYVVPNDAPKAWHDSDDFTELCPYGVPGDLLWVREAWKAHSTFNGIPPRDITPSTIFWLADNAYSPSGAPGRPGIHMPRWASRLTLEITSVRVARLQDISEGDAEAEGWPHVSSDDKDVPLKDAYPVGWYGNLWESINGAGSWDANPWVWVVQFCVHQQNIDELLKAGRHDA